MSLLISSAVSSGRLSSKRSRTSSTFSAVELERDTGIFGANSQRMRLDYCLLRFMIADGGGGVKGTRGDAERLEIGDWRLEIGDWRLETKLLPQMSRRGCPGAGNADAPTRGTQIFLGS